MKIADMPKLNDLPPMLTPEEVAPLLRVTPPTIRKWVRDKTIEGGVIIGGRVLVRKSSVERFING